MCLYPRLIPNGKYRKSIKNGGDVPIAIDRRVMSVPVGCGRCMECVKKKAREWQVRLLEDIRENKNGKFVTFTFSNESIAEIVEMMPNIMVTKWVERNGKRIKVRKKKYPEMPTGYELDNEIATTGVRYFLERWRKKHKISLRHWLVTELGHKGTENIHLHGIVWTNHSMDEVEKHWKYGFVWKGKRHLDEMKNYVGERTVNYITKYIHKVDLDHKEYKSKVLTSAGIGACYMKRVDWRRNEYKEGGETKEGYKTRTGHEMAMPVYWRNKIYTDEEREKLWLEKLDKQIRYVNGEMVDISNGEEDYYKLLEYHRGRAMRLGYQNNEIDWKKKRYEEERRYYLTKQRIDDGNEKRSLRGLRIAPEGAESINRQGLRPSENW